MILDSSAIVALFLQEPGYQELREKMGSARSLAIGAPTLVETGIVLSARLGWDARGLLARYATEVDLATVPFGAEHYPLAVDAWLRFGKRRHPANRNFGDCLTYAIARLSGDRLLCVGDDFTHTDLELA